MIPKFLGPIIGSLAPYILAMLIPSAIGAYYFIDYRSTIKAEHKAEVSGLTVVLKEQKVAIIAALAREQLLSKIAKDLKVKEQQRNQEITAVIRQIREASHECSNETVIDVLGPDLDRLLSNSDDIGS